ncbi:hypothetical protein [Ferrovum sp.]|uniref:hypothetical protein n=1 Tax=Ferrovum sp. TaxID=2609467 RepID=UPI0026390B11|nr:hypothetical protein [Ferrovum sp.]
MPAKVPPDLWGIPASELTSLLRFVGGLDFWRFPLRGQLPMPCNISPPNTEELIEGWDEVIRNPTFAKLLHAGHFRQAFTMFDRQLKPDLRQKIRYFHIVLNALHNYQIEQTWPSFTGLGTATQRKQAIKGAQGTLRALRGGVHLGTDRIHENQELATLLSRYIHELRCIGTVRRDKSLPKRRFFERVICEFLLAFKKPMKGVLLHFYVCLSTNARGREQLDERRVLARYIQNARRRLAQPPSPRTADWFGGDSRT